MAGRSLICYGRAMDDDDQDWPLPPSREDSERARIAREMVLKGTDEVLVRLQQAIWAAEDEAERAEWSGIEPLQ